MCRTEERLWKFKLGRVLVALDISPDDDTDTSFDETGETAEKLASGEWVAFQSALRVYVDGHELGVDYLGGSIYDDPRKFRVEHIGSQGKWGSYFTDMVHTAIAEAREELLRLQSFKVRGERQELWSGGRNIARGGGGQYLLRP